MARLKRYAVAGRLQRFTRPGDGLFLDRRVFLISYDPQGDDDGRIVEGILLAAGLGTQPRELEYDHLVIALGNVTNFAELPGLPRVGLYDLAIV